MNILTLITEGNELNSHYEVESVSIAPSCTVSCVDSKIDGKFVIIIKQDEIDDVLSDFIDGNSGYRIQVDTDLLRIESKGKCYSASRIYCDGENMVAFIINVEKRVS